MGEQAGVISRRDAKARGLKRYFTGRECSCGHIAERRVSNKKCVICSHIGAVAWKLANPDRARAYGRKWKSNNPISVVAYNKEWTRNNPDKRRESTRRWRRNNPDKARASYLKSYAFRKGVSGEHSAEDIADIRRMQKDKCAICRKRLCGGGHVDHIHPISRGGDNYRSNLQFLCERCNCQKRGSDPVDHMQSLGFLC